MTRTYVITGGASGIGASSAALLRDRGQQVVTVDLHDADVVGDLSSKDGRVAAAKAAIDRAGGKVDAVIACAGLAHPIAKTVSVNFFGVTEFLDAIRPAMVGTPAPRVAVTSSMASLMPNSPDLVAALLANDEPKAVEIAQQLADDPQLGGLIYGSSKRAVSRWIRRVAPTADWAGAGIPINAVGPGIVETPMVADMIATAEGRAGLAQVVPMPLNGYLKPMQVAYLLTWLTSEENTHLCGQTIYIDGGSDVVIRGEDIWSKYDQ